MIGRVFLNLGLDGTMKKAFFIFLMNFIFSTLVWNNAAWSGNWNTGSKSSPFLKLVEKQPNLESTVAGCYGFYKEMILIKEMTLAGEIMRKQKDLIGTSKDLVGRLISQDILVHYLLEDGRMETEEGKKLMSIADKSEKVFNPDSAVDGSEKVGILCTKASNAFQLKHKAVADNARSSSMTIMSDKKQAMLQLTDSCNSKFPVKKGQSKNISEHMLCLMGVR